MKQIQLPNNKFAIVDDEDYEYLNQWKWHTDGRYVKRAFEKPKENGKRRRGKIYMHRFIMRFPKDLVDHINNDKLDNRKINLRTVTSQESTINRKKYSKKQIYKGTERKGNRWLVRITKDYKRHYVGCFKTAEKAAVAYDKTAIKLHGKYANLNFPKL